jgi:hypothetical protein
MLFSFHPIFVQESDLHKKGSEFPDFLCKAPGSATRRDMADRSSSPKLEVIRFFVSSIVALLSAAATTAEAQVRLAARLFRCLSWRPVSVSTHGAVS